MSNEAKYIWTTLSNVMDPEIPVVSLVEMGIVRDVSVTDNTIQVTITPTFSGCPALEVMKKDIKEALKIFDYSAISVIVTLSPPWSTDWISEEGRRKLKEFGITPPHVHAGNIHQALLQPVECPNCNSIKTTLRNSFGPTPCRMIFTCNDCQQPFEQFKPL